MAGQPRSVYASGTRFSKFVLSRTPATRSENQKLASHLEHNPIEIGSILNDSLQGVYFSDFEFYTRNIINLLLSVTPVQISQPEGSNGIGTATGPAKARTAHVTGRDGQANKFRSKAKQKKDTGFTAGAQTVLPLPEGFVDYLILPLLKLAEKGMEEADFLETSEFIELVMAVLRVYIPPALTSKSSLKPLHNMLLSMTAIPAEHHLGIVERLFASEKGGALMKTLFLSKATLSKVFNSGLLETYTSRIAVMVQNCVVSHGEDMERTLDEWCDIQDLKCALIRLQQSFTERERLFKKRPKLPPVGKENMGNRGPTSGRTFLPPEPEKPRILGSYPWSYNKAAQKKEPALPTPELNPNEVATLRRICGKAAQSPQSTGALSTTLNDLESHMTLSVLQRLVETFPCSACYKHISTDAHPPSFPSPEIHLPKRVAIASEQTQEAVHHIQMQKATGREKKNPKKYEWRDKRWKQDKAQEPNSYHVDIDNIDHISIVDGRRVSSPALAPLPGPWTLILSSQALKDLQQAQREGCFRTIRRVLEELATGDWCRRGLTKPHKAEGMTAATNVSLSPGGKVGPVNPNGWNDSQQWQIEEWTGTGLDNKVLKLYKAIYGKNHRILWGVEGAWDEEHDGWRQIIKIHKIGDHKEILDAIPSVLRAHRTYSPEYIKACKLRDSKPGTQLHVPARFSFTKEADTSNAVGKYGHMTSSIAEAQRKLTREEALGLHEASITNKFYTLTSQLLKSLIAAHAAGVQPEFAFNITEEETQIIRENRSVLVLGRSGTGKTTCLVYKLLSGYLARRECGINIRQIFLTRSPILADKIKLYLKRLIESQLCDFSNVLTEQPIGPAALVEREDRWGDPKDGTRDLFHIKDSEWPLVCTYEDFCNLLEKTLEVADRSSFQTTASSEIVLSHEQRRVDYEKFKSKYWPKIPAYLRKGLCVDLVFAELSGIIKCGKYETKFTPLTREQYDSVSSRIAPIQNHADRDRIYRIYELYQERLAQNREWDDLDRCRNLRTSLLRDESLTERVRQVFTEAYVDEVQDLRMSELGLLLQLVMNPHGVHLAGDTAQSISRESVFRFQDAKALYWSVYGAMVKKGNEKPKADLAKPRMFTLSMNYRSHQGILALASAVVDLLWRVFPDSIDKLQPEIGQSVGPRPSLFVGFSSELFGNRMFGIVNVALDLSDFGAEQVVLVRDDASRDKLQKEVGGTLILTILESKGMEFEDVLLYNYFTEAPAAAAGFRALAANEFDARNHAIICAELKGFYVAITRGRSRLWLIEQDGDAVIPLIKLWAGKTPGKPALIDVVRPGDKGLPEILKDMRQGTSNNPEDWHRKGVEFVEKRLWQPALQCFEKAGDKQGKSLAKAHITEARAQDLAAQPDAAKELFRLASALFLAAEHPRQACRCLVTIRDFTAAANIWVERKDHKNAAALFEQGGMRKEAARHYHLAGLKDDAARSYREGEYFDILLEYLSQHKDSINPTLFRKYSRLVNVLFLKNQGAKGQGVKKHLQLLAIDLLGSTAEKEAFLKQYDMHKDLLTHYNQTGETEKAIILLVNGEGDYKTAAKLLTEKRPDFNAIGPEFSDEVFKCVQTAHLQYTIPKLLVWESMANVRKEEFLMAPGDPDEVLPSFLLRRKWNKLLEELSAWFLQLKCGSENTGGGELIDEDLRLTIDLFITNHGSFFAENFRPQDFPLQSVIRCSEAVKKLVKTGTPPEALRRYYGVSDIEETPELVWVLQSSVLLKEGPSIKMSRDAAYKMISSALSNELAKTIYTLEAKGWEMARAGALCEEFAIKGSCKYEANCRFLKGHRRLSQIDANRNVELLSSFAEAIPHALSFSYYNRLLNSKNSEAYRGTVRRWLEQLLFLTTFSSEYLTHPMNCVALLFGASANATDSDSKRALKNELEDLMYFRIKNEKIRWWNFSGLLEAHQLAESLGVTGLGPMVQSHINWGSLTQDQWTSFTTIANVFNLQNALACGDITTFFEYLWLTCTSIRTLVFDDLQFFHSVLTFWEKQCCFLIALGFPDEFLIKDSWRKVYFRDILHYLTAYEGFTPDQQYDITYESKRALDMVIETILDVLKRLDFENSASNLKGLFNKRSELLVRRLMDLLGICFCNIKEPCGLYALPGSLDARIIEAWNGWRKYLKLPPLIDRDVGKFMLVFAQHYAQSYPVEIDNLAAMKKASIKPSKYRFMKPSWAVSRLSFPSFVDFDRTFLSIKKRKHTQRSPVVVEDESNKESNRNSAYKDVHFEAARKIQSFWKKYKPLLAWHRDWSKTPEGRSHAKIKNLCDQLRKTPNDESPHERFIRLMILRRGGLPAEVAIHNANARVMAVKQHALAQLKDMNIGSKMVERIDEGVLEIEDLERELVLLKSSISLGRKIIELALQELEKFLAELQRRAIALSDRAIQVGKDIGFKASVSDRAMVA